MDIGRAGRSLGTLATAVLLLAALPFAVVLLLALREVHVGLSAAQVVFFYLPPVMWLVGTAWALRLPASTRVDLALAVVSVGFALLLSEVATGVWFASRSAAAGTRPSILSEVLRMREAGIDAFPKIPGNSLVNLSPLLSTEAGDFRPITPGPGNATILLCNERGPLRTYESDAFGFDNPPEAWAPPGPDVVLVGDSYTAGVCVEEEDRLGNLLRSEWRVLNLGTSGAGPLQELALLREYGAALEPRIVVWIYYEGNDLWDLGRESDREWLRRYLDADHSQSLVANRDIVDEAYRVWIDSLIAAESTAAGASSIRSGRSGLTASLRLPTLRRLARFEVLFPKRQSALGVLPQILLRAHDDVASWGGSLLLVYMPTFDRYHAFVGEAVAGRSELLDLARASGITVIDLHGVFTATDDPQSLWPPPRTHLDSRGYRIAADAISRAIARASTSKPPQGPRR